MTAVKGKWLWIAQRVTSGVLLLHALLNAVWWAGTASLDWAALLAWVQNPWMVAFNVLVMVTLVVHAGVGLWVVGTDYIRPMQFGRLATPLRVLYEIGCALFLLLVFFYGLSVLVRI